ncbi:MAG: tetratricopeptide repeat protein [Alphaproteobacteria bacterium]
MTETAENIRAEAIRLVNAGRSDEAERYCLDRLRDYGRDGLILRTLGSIRHMKGDKAGAADALQGAIEVSPDNAQAWADLGAVLGSQDDTAGAIRALHKAYTIDPQLQAAGQNLGLALMKANRPDDAAIIFRRLIETGFASAAVYGWLGHAEAALDHPEQAADAYRTALRDKPGDANIMLTLAIIERDLGDLEGSIARFETLLAQDPDNAVYRFAQAQNRLILGDFENGFDGYEWRWKRPGMVRPEFGCPAWNGEPLAGKSLLIYDEQGLGDTLQFCRFALSALEAGASVSLLVRPRLHRLMAGLSDRIDIVTDDEARARPFDFSVPLMSLPRLLGTRPDTIPAQKPYLFAEPRLAAEWAARLTQEGDGRPRIGLIWQGDPKSQSEKGRSVGFRTLSPLLADRTKRFFLLQTVDGRDQLNGMALPDNVTDLGDQLDTGSDGFIDTAAVMQHMSLVISSDTGPAHLAGALGRPAWLMVKKVPEWRWMLNRTDSPWYPSFRLYRQNVRGDWHDVVGRIADDLSDPRFDRAADRENHL